MWFVLFLLLGGGIYWGASRGQRQIVQRWQAALAPFGRIQEGSSTAMVRARTESALQIRVTSAEKEDYIVSVVVPEPLAFPEMEIERNPLELPWVHETAIGDPEFEKFFRTLGPVRLVSSVLDSETRRLITGLGSEGLKIADRQLSVMMTLGQVPSRLPPLLKLAERFAHPPDVVQSLAENARQDPVAGVRLRNLVLLLSELPGDPRMVEILRDACSDASPRIRLRAAKELGAEGCGVLQELAESAEDDAVSSEAITVLGRELPVERARDILALGLARRHVQTAHACMRRLAFSEDAADLDRLANVAEGEHPVLALAAIRALEASANPAAEPPLILALRREPESLRVAAANALGRLGSAAAVLPLQEAAESARSASLRRAIRQAIAEIQSRLPGASPGQLSLASVEAGNLSLAQTEAGRLSLTADPAGQLDLTDK